MTLRNIMVKLKTALFLVFRLLQGVVSFFIVLWKMELSTIVSRYLRSFKEALSQKKFLDVDLMSYSLWNCFSYYPAVTTWDILEAQAGKYIGKDKKWHHGKYLFTVDFAHPEANILDTDHSEIPHEHKCAHIIALDDGNYAAQPNNRCIWDIPSFTVKDNIPDWKVQTSEWNVENTSKWKTEDTDNFFYEIEEKKHD
jgi:hypothetical protein